MYECQRDRDENCNNFLLLGNDSIKWKKNRWAHGTYKKLWRITDFHCIGERIDRLLSTFHRPTIFFLILFFIVINRGNIFRIRVSTRQYDAGSRGSSRGFIFSGVISNSSSETSVRSRDKTWNYKFGPQNPSRWVSRSDRPSGARARDERTWTSQPRTGISISVRKRARYTR